MPRENQIDVLRFTLCLVMSWQQGRACESAFVHLGHDYVSSMFESWEGEGSQYVMISGSHHVPFFEAAMLQLLESFV
jgi:hypothetical protein